MEAITYTKWLNFSLFFIIIHRFKLLKRNLSESFSEWFHFGGTPKNAFFGVSKAKTLREKKIPKNLYI
jgi:hypothetical protein